MHSLLIIDVQNDFCPGGALAVPGGDDIIPVINSLSDLFKTVVITKDWHPKNHKSFASSHAGKNPGDIIQLHGIQQVLWPNHCVQNTYGSELRAGLNIKDNFTVIYKGTDPEIDSYSAFMDNNKVKKTGLDAYLKEKSVAGIVITGLATDYCVRFSALDALSLGYEVSVVTDAVKGVDLQKGDSARALEEMASSGAQLIEARYIVNKINNYEKKTKVFDANAD